MSFLGLCKLSELKDSIDNAKRLESKYEHIINKLHKKQFRVGDIVYINDNNHDYNTPYFLRESYNDRECWYVTRTENGIYDKSLHFAVMTRDISHEAPKVCRCCNQLIK